MAKTPNKTPDKKAISPNNAPGRAAASPDEAPKPRFGKGQPAHYCGKKGRSGAPKGSANAMRHGLRAGKLPKDAKYIEWQMNSLRRELEAAVIAVKGEVNLLDAATIQTAVKWERHGALALRWLRVEGDKLKPTERLHFSREIARASTERDKALAALGLDVKPEPIDLTTYLQGGNGNERPQGDK